MRDIPWPVVASALPAFLLEATLFLALGVDRVRLWLEKLAPWQTALLLTISSVVPYCAAALAFGRFDARALGLIALIAGAVAFWYVLLPHRAPIDVAFLL